MKRIDLKVGMEVGIASPRNKRYPRRGIVVETAPWKYYGSTWNKKARRADKGSGVAVAEIRGIDTYPRVIPLGQLTPWEDANAEAERIAVEDKAAHARRQEAETRRKAAVARLREITKNLAPDIYISEYDNSLNIFSVLTLVEAALDNRPQA